MSVWRAGSSYGSWAAGSGKRTTNLVGICTNRGPDGQRYMFRQNKFCGGILNKVCGKKYSWVDWNEGLDSPFINQVPASEADWNSCWNQGFHPYVPPTPADEIADPTLSDKTFSSIEQIDWRIALAVGVSVLALIYAVIVIKSNK